MEEIQEEKTLINYWEQSGLLVQVPEERKTLYAKNFERARKYMLQRDTENSVAVFIFPLLYRVIGMDNDVDVIELIEDFIRFYKEKQYELWTDYFENFTESEDVEKKFLDSYIDQLDYSCKIDFKKSTTRKQKEEMEDFFLSVFNGLSIKTNVKQQPESVFYIKNNKIYMIQSEKNKIFYLRHVGFWDVFEDKFGLNHKRTREFVGSMLKKHFKISGYIPDNISITKEGMLNEEQICSEE